MKRAPIAFAVLILGSIVATGSAIGFVPAISLVAWTFAAGWIVDQCCQ